jgi:DNA-binding protein H-NS
MIKDTIKTMHALLDALKKDLHKAEKGNKAASQRIRTGSIKLGKIAKVYRKESVLAEKKGSFKKTKPSKKKPEAKKVKGKKRR